MNFIQVFITFSMYVYFISGKNTLVASSVIALSYITVVQDLFKFWKKVPFSLTVGQKFKKVQAKKLVKSNKSISQKF